MQRCGEATIRRPPIPHQDTVEVRPSTAAASSKPRPGQIRYTVVSGVANAHSQCRTAPTRQPVSSGLTRLPRICSHNAVGRGGYAGGAMQHVHEASGRHAQPEALPQERGHLRERHADFFVQARHQRDGARPQVDVGGPDRVRGLRGCRPCTRRPHWVHCPTCRIGTDLRTGSGLDCSAGTTRRRSGRYCGAVQGLRIVTLSPKRSRRSAAIRSGTPTSLCKRRHQATAFGLDVGGPARPEVCRGCRLANPASTYRRSHQSATRSAGRGEGLLGTAA